MTLFLGRTTSSTGSILSSISTKRRRGTMDRPIPSSSNILLSTAVTLAIVGATQLSLAQTAAPKQQDGTSGANAKTTGVSAGSDATEPTRDPGSGTEQQPSSTSPSEGASSGAAPVGAAPLPPVPPPPAPAVMSVAPPLAAPLAAQADEAPASTSWFARTPISTTIGTGPKRLMLTLYGFVDASVIHDSTRSYDETMGPTLVARHDTYAGRAGRTQFTPRGTRLGLMLQMPEVGGVRTSGVITYGIGPQPS